MSGMKLKADNGIMRYPDRNARNEPIEPLTPEEKDHLKKVCWTKCKNGYKRRISNGFLSDFESIEDLDGEAWIFMCNILDKFDKHFYKNQIAEYDEEGETGKKTLEFFFETYISGRVNFVACEAREFKRKRGIGPKGAVDEVSYDEEITGSFSKYDYDLEVTGEIYSLLETKSPEFKRFFYEHYIVQCSQKELREEFGSSFNRLKQELTKFRSEIKKKLTITYLKDVNFRVVPSDYKKEDSSKVELELDPADVDNFDENEDDFEDDLDD